MNPGPSKNRLAVILPGLGRVRRGAEAAFLEIARRLADYPDFHVELFGSSDQDVDGLVMNPTRCWPRERFEGWPSVPCFRTECYYEEFGFVFSLSKSGRYRPANFDFVLTCTYPWVNWFVRWAGRKSGPVHVFVTENGDWMCQAQSREFRYFGCDGLVCTNPAYFERHRSRYRSVLIPNGVDPNVFRPRNSAQPQPSERKANNEARGLRTVVMASAMITSKDVAGGVKAVARVPDAFLLVAGDGPERETVARLAQELLPGRHELLGSVPRSQMPDIFREADVFVHMSRDEPSALVYLEAASTGLPLVVHDSEITRWTLGEAAVFVDTADIERTAAALSAALEPHRGSQLGAAAREHVLDGWSWDVLAARYREFFLALRAERQEAKVKS